MPGRAWAQTPSLRTWVCPGGSREQSQACRGGGEDEQAPSSQPGDPQSLGFPPCWAGAHRRSCPGRAQLCSVGVTPFPGLALLPPQSGQGQPGRGVVRGGHRIILPPSTSPDPSQGLSFSLSNAATGPLVTQPREGEDADRAEGRGSLQVTQAECQHFGDGGGGWGGGDCSPGPFPAPTAENQRGRDSLWEDYSLIPSRSHPRLQRRCRAGRREGTRGPTRPASALPHPASALRRCRRLFRKPSGCPVPVTRPCRGFSRFPHMTLGEAGPHSREGGPLAA